MTGMGAVRLLVTIFALCSGLAPEWVQADATFTRPDGVILEAAQTDATVERLMRAGNVPGSALALIGDGKLAHLQAYGMADASGARPLNTDTVMYGASLTKAASVGPRQEASAPLVPADESAKRGGPIMLSPEFEKHCFEPANERALCARAGIAH